MPGRSTRGQEPQGKRYENGEHQQLPHKKDQHLALELRRITACGNVCICEMDRGRGGWVRGQSMLIYTYFVTDALNLTRSTPFCFNTSVGPHLLQGSPKQTNAQTQVNIAVCLFILLQTSYACTTTELLYLCGRRLFAPANAPFPIKSPPQPRLWQRT